MLQLDKQTQIFNITKFQGIPINKLLLNIITTQFY